jgi:hypothetical protein
MRRQASGKEGSSPEIDIILAALRASLLLPPRTYDGFAKKVAIDGWRASLPVLLESLRNQLRQNYDMGPFCRTKNVRGGKLEHDGQNEKRTGDMLAALHVLTSLCRLKEDVTAKESTDVGELLIALLPFLQPSVRAIQMLIAILTDSIAHGLSKKMQLLLVKSLRTALRDEQQLQAVRRPDFSEEETHKRYGGDIFMDAFAEEHKSTSRIVGRSVRPHCYFTLGCRNDSSSHESSANRSEAAATQNAGVGGGRILLPPADLHHFRGYTFTCWLHLEGGGGTKTTMPSSGRQSPGLSVPSGFLTDSDGHMLLFRLHASPPSDCAVEVYLSRHSVGGGVRKLTILTSSSESGVEWKMTKGEVMLPPDRWVLFTMSHSLPYIQRSKVMVLINGVLQFETYQLYPQERPSMHISAVGGFWQRQPRTDDSEREREQQPLLSQNSVVSNQPSHGGRYPAPPTSSSSQGLLPPSPTKKREDGRSCFAGEGFVGKVGSIVLYGEALTMDLVNLLFHAGPDYTSLQLPIAVPPDPHHSWNATVGIALCEGDMVKAAAKAPLIFAFDPSKASTNTLCGGEATSRQSDQRDSVSDVELGNGHQLGKGTTTKPSGSTGDATWQEVWVEESRLHGKLSSFPIKGPVKLPMYSNSNVGHSSRMLILSDTATMDEKRLQGTTFARLDGSVRVVKYPNWPNLWYQTGGVQSILAIVSQLCDFTSSRGSSFRAGKEYQDGAGTDFPHELCNLALITEMTYFLSDLLGRSPTLREDCLQRKGIYLLASCFKQIRVPPPPRSRDPNFTMVGAERTTTLSDDCAPLLLHLAKATWMLIEVLGHEWFRPPRHWLGPSNVTSGNNVCVGGAPPQLLTQAMGCLWCDWGFWGRTPWLVQKWLLDQQRIMAFDMASTANNRLSMLIPIPALLFMLRTHFLPEARPTPQGPSGMNVNAGDPLPPRHPADVSSHPTSSSLSRCEKIQGIELLASVMKYVLMGDLMAVCVVKELRSFEELSEVLVFHGKEHDGKGLPPTQKASASRLVVGSSLPSGGETLGLSGNLTKKVTRQDKTKPDETRRD